jgi:MOSC domain-containing protein YiiM
MKIAGIAIGGIEEIPYRGKKVKTGIFKKPIRGPIFLGREGLEGDVQVDRKNHGGPDKAVYAYSLENLHYWSTLRKEPDYAPGHMGENLTLEGLDDHAVSIGDQFQIGTAIVEVTQPRVPCFKLGIRMQKPQFVGEFLNSGRTGFYLRVLQEGQIETGDGFTRIHEDPRKVSIPNAMKALIKGPDQALWIAQTLSVPALSTAWREDLKERAHTTHAEGDSL